MGKRWRLAIYDMNENRLCPLFDSNIEQQGDAYSIKRTRELSGWKELSFNLSRLTSDKLENFRCDFIAAENIVRVYEDDEYDVFRIKEPMDLHDSSKMQISVHCVHISEELKTKNLYKYFDDENGIGTCPELIEKAIAGTGWKLASCDKFLEMDGVTEKVRSYACDTKTGAYNMISGICSLFNARPVFHGATRTIEIRSIHNSSGWMEVMFGKNANKIQRNANSDNLITRLYVEGEYGDYGYVGIDSENPTGLPFILNFDYYKERGLFTDKHQAIVDKYLIDYKAAVDSVSAGTTELLEKEGKLSELIGVYGYSYYPVSSTIIDLENAILGRNISAEDSKLKSGDVVAVIKSDGAYEYAEYPPSISSSVVAIIKFSPTITGLLAAYEDIEKAAANNVSAYLEKINETLAKEGYSEVTVMLLKNVYETQDLSIIKDESFDLSGVEAQYRIASVLDYASTIGQEEKRAAEATEKKKQGMLDVIGYIVDIDSLSEQILTDTNAQVDIETQFNIDMGSMLRDGYWSDENYVTGQEASLYQDALEISKKMAHPIATYVASVQNLARLSKYRDEEFDIAQTIRMYDPDMKINDCGVVSKFVEHPDAPLSDSLEISTDVLDIGNKTFVSILERVTEMAEKVRQNKEIYERAVAISKDGTIRSDILEGAIDVLKVKLLSTASNWRTDENGNIIMESLDGTSAMMLCGSGFMCANTKTESGAWNWRTFGTGDGFTADMIVAGYLSAERIEAHSIGVDRLVPSVGSDLDISKNTAIELVDGKIKLIVSDGSTESELVLTEQMLRAIAKHVQVVANDIDLSANKSINLRVSTLADEKSTIYRSETIPVDAKLNDIWIQPSTGYTYQMAGSTTAEFFFDGSADLFTTGESFYIDENGDLYSLPEDSFELGVNGEVTHWQRVKDGDLTAAELKLTPEGIMSTVTGTQQWHEAETAISENSDNLIRWQSEFNQRMDGFEININRKVDGDSLRTYLRYQDGKVQIGRSDSRYATETSDSGFVVLQDGKLMTSMEKNTVTAPVMEAKRQFQVGNFVIRTGANGGLLIL